MRNVRQPWQDAAANPFSAGPAEPPCVGCIARALLVRSDDGMGLRHDGMDLFFLTRCGSCRMMDLVASAHVASATP